LAFICQKGDDPFYDAINNLELVLSCYREPHLAIMGDLNGNHANYIHQAQKWELKRVPACMLG